MPDQHPTVEAWLLQYQDRVLRLAYTLLGNREAAEDAAQDSLFHIARWCLAHADFVPTDAWVWQVTRNAVRDAVRRHPPYAVPLDDGVLVDDTVEDLPVERMDVARALAALSVPDREILVFYYFLDLTSREVARVLGISATAARIRLSRARKRFAAVYGRAGKEGPSHEAR